MNLTERSRVKGRPASTATARAFIIDSRSQVIAMAFGIQITMKIKIVHLHQYPECFPVVAQWIHEEWWSSKPGHSAETMEPRLRQASNPQQIPLSLLAMENNEPVGTVNLAENDDEHRPYLYPWLATLLVLPGYRGQGIGSELVRTLLGESRRLKIKQMYLGTGKPPRPTPCRWKLSRLIRHLVLQGPFQDVSQLITRTLAGAR
jgi:predicted N-acetyltransferase YhbS